MPFMKSLIYYLSVIFMFNMGLLGAPFRILYEFLSITHPDFFRRANNPEKHRNKVAKIQKQIKEWNKSGRKRLLCSSRASWKKFAMRDFENSERNQIDVDIEDIIEIDTENKTITIIEPRMKMGTLTCKLLPLGWTIPIIPEFQELTIGGLICGFGIESSCNKYGDFTKQCLSYEIVLPTGECVTCSKDENFDLYEAIPMSYGTLGFLTAVKFPLLPAKKFVELKYYPASDKESAIRLLQDSSHEFVEGLQFGENKFVVMHGDLVDKAPRNKIRTFLKWWDQVFHWDVERYLKKPPGSIKYIPLRDYYHRHTKAYFWVFSKPLSIHKWTIIRYTLGWGLPINFNLAKLLDSMLTCGSTGGFRNKYLSACNHFLQDYIVPKIYPIWLCPIRIHSSKGMIQPIGNKETLYVDVGVYGFSKKASGNLTDIWKKYEQYTLENKGLIFFYTDSYLTRNEFDKMFPQELYTEVRKKYKCDGAFPHIYDKVSLASRRVKNDDRFATEEEFNKILP